MYCRHFVQLQLKNIEILKNIVWSLSTQIVCRRDWWRWGHPGGGWQCSTQLWCCVTHFSASHRSVWQQLMPRPVSRVSPWWWTTCPPSTPESWTVGWWTPGPCLASGASERRETSLSWGSRGCWWSRWWWWSGSSRGILGWNGTENPESVQTSNSLFQYLGEHSVLNQPEK